MSEEHARIPKSLSAFQGSFPMERRRVKLSTLNGTSHSAGGNVRLRFPDRALIDMSTWSVDFLSTTTAGGTSTGANVPVSYALMKSLQFIIGGVNVGSSQNFQNQIAHAVNLASRSSDYDRSNMVAKGYNNISTAVYQTNTPTACNWFPYTLASCGVLDTAVFGGLEVDIRLEGNDCLNVIGGTGATYAISSLVSYVDILLPASDSYTKTIASRLASGGSVRKSVPTSVGFNQVQTGSNSVNCATNSLDAVMVGVKTTAWGSQALQGAHLYNGFLSYSLANTTANQLMHLQLANGQQYPAYGNGENSFEYANMSRNWAGKTSAFNTNKLFFDQTADDTDVRTQNLYLERNFVWFAQVGGEGSGVDHGGLHTGLDTQGSSNIIRINSTNLAATDELMIGCMCSSILEGRAGGLIGFVQ
jgi:hypothetical protein